MDLAVKLAKIAKKKGICDEWRMKLEKMTDKNAMMDMYLDGIDFCLMNNYPSNDFIREHFKGQGMEEKGIFLDDNFGIINDIPKCVSLGVTSGVIKTSGYNVCEIFAKHHSMLSVIAKDDAFVMVDVFDDSIIQVCAQDRAKICVNHYGGEIKEMKTENGQIKIREKNKKTY